MSLEKEFVELGERLVQLGNKHAVLVAREEQKATEREILEKELSSAGVNVAELEGEAARLEAEMRKSLIEAKAKVDLFEAELNTAAGGVLVKVVKTPPIAEPIVEYRRGSVPLDDELDI